MTEQDNENDGVRVYRRSHGRLRPELRPIVLEYKSRDDDDDDDDEGEERYSGGLKDIQRMEADLVRVARRATRAMAEGIDTYDRERSRSASEKEDGAIRDFIPNTGKAMSAYLEEASEIPMDVAEAINTQTNRRQLRRGLRRVSRVMRLWPL